MKKDKLISNYNETISDESIVKNTRLWYTFYASPLQNFWKENKNNRTQEELYQLISRMFFKPNTKEERSADTVKNFFIRENKHTLPREYLKGVICLLMETNFYDKFFDIGMSHRLDLKNTEREARNSYLYLKTNIAEKEDLFWGRWIELYRLRYDSQSLKYEELDAIYEKIKKEISSNIKKNPFEKELGIIKKYSESMSDLLSERCIIYNTFYNICFLLNFRSFLRDKNYNNFRKIAPLKEIEIEEKILQIIDTTEKYIQDIKKILENSSTNSRFNDDFKMICLHHNGNKMIGKYITAFPKMEKRKREELLLLGEDFINNLKPELNSSKIYRIWYDYYNYLYNLRILENSIALKHFESSLEFCNKCLELLDKLDEKLKGGFLRICIKIRYHRRNIHYIYHTIDAILLENSLESSEEIDYIKNELILDKRDDSFRLTQQWINEIFIDNVKIT